MKAVRDALRASVLGGTARKASGNKDKDSVEIEDGKLVKRKLRKNYLHIY